MSPVEIDSASESGLVRILPIDSIAASPENVELYRPVLDDDPEIVALSASIREHGIKEPLVITSDGWILSGHRRYAAAKLAGLQSVPCRIEQISRCGDRDRFMVALREHNRQREKSFDEKVRESVVSMSPADAYKSLIKERAKAARVDVEQMELCEPRRRARISDAKIPFLNAVIRVLNSLKEFWPVGERAIHYNLLNAPPLRHASKPGSRYQNNKRSSKDLSDLVTRARIVGLIPSGIIGDETRPVTLYDCCREPSSFISKEIDGLFKGYWRDLMQSQPNHIEVVVEKNTVANVLKPVVEEYCIPMTSGRGYSSYPPREDTRDRFKKSGKERLIIICVGDFDPDGEVIAESFARSMRDDFGLDVIPVKAGLTLEQVVGLPSSLEPKESSAQYEKFVAKYGPEQMAHELEAIAPTTLQNILRKTIDTVIDRRRFNYELRQEKEDATKIAGLRSAILDTEGGQIRPERRP